MSTRSENDSGNRKSFKRITSRDKGAFEDAEVLRIEWEGERDDKCETCLSIGSHRQPIENGISVSDHQSTGSGSDSKSSRKPLQVFTMHSRLLFRVRH